MNTKIPVQILDIYQEKPQLNFLQSYMEKQTGKRIKVPLVRDAVVLSNRISHALLLDWFYMMVRI